jgi:hypothetical protein
MNKICFAVFAVSLAALPAAVKIAGGPFVVHVTPRSAEVVWLTERNPSDPGSGPFQVQKKILKDLKPNTRYEYDAGEQQKAGWFKTPPVDDSPYRFVVYGDTRTRHDVHRHVVEAMLKYSTPDFLIHTGDLVADGNAKEMWPVFFGIEKELLRKAAFFPSLGNHERNSREFYDIFQVEKPYYSFDWGNGHFIVLNSDIGNAAPTPREKDEFWTAQTRWLEEDLKAHQDARFRFVAAHHPPFTAVARRQGDNPQMTALVPLFERYHVSAGFFGHDHNYQHYLKNGIHYIITGGGGAPLYDVDKPAQGITLKVVSTEHFVTVAVDGDKAEVKAIAVDGRILDTAEILGSRY